MQRIRNGLLFLLAAAAFFMAPCPAPAADYVIDTKNAHAFIQFKISHLGFSYILGRFNHFDGVFSYDEKDRAASNVKVTVDVASVDTNNSERDKHLRSEKFFEVKKYPEAEFVSTSVEVTGDKTALLKGEFTLHGVTRPIEIKVTELGAGKDPWGGFRRGFEGRVTLALKDYNIKTPGPTASKATLFLSIEGIRQK